MSLIEKYIHDDIGYNPFLIREGWQVAKLNHLPGHGFDDIAKMEMHNYTDEVFILFSGTAILIASSNGEGTPPFELINMVSGVVYNIPQGVWHNIAMSPDAEIIIVEKNNTHLNDVEYIDLDQRQSLSIKNQIESIL